MNKKILGDTIFVTEVKIVCEECLMKIEKQKNFLIRFIFLTVVLGLVYIGVQYVLPAVLPLALALLIAVALKNPIKKISESKKWNRTLVSVVMLIIFYAITYN